ncbi:MAG: twin-arginine translocase subunit TatC [Solirubrobacterales bacterium]|nr:twin-arginine translocase subunit TatC [Solirubrobacterales bacterium]
MPRIRPVSHEDELSIVDHLDELRSRLMIAISAFVVAFAVCAWQSDRILEFVNKPLPPEFDKPITFGVTEPFTTTFTNSAYAAILISLPIILYQLYAFVLPAFSPSEKRVAKPLMLMVPFLFIAGVAFCYYVVLPPATDFLLSFNASEFNTQVRARDYYSFATLTMVAMGLGFQVPVLILALVKLNIVTTRQLRQNRRYAVLVIAVLAALLPTIDPITMLLEMVPLLLLYEASIWLATWLTRPSSSAAEVAAADGR